MQNIQRVIIVGGGTAGWMTAAALAKILGSVVDFTLVESEQIGTVGVGEATIPSIRLFNNLLGIDEATFLKATKGTVKLGIEFNNWGAVQDSYMHAFGNIGLDLGMAKFYQYWFKQRQHGDVSSLWDYSFNALAAKQNRFQPIESIQGTPLSGLTYAYHFDAGLYALMLREYSEKLAVKRIEGLVEDVQLAPETGHISSISLNGGTSIEGDLFIDCSGSRGLLIEQALGVGYEDWSKFLPCNRAVTVASRSDNSLPPYTSSTALTAGWQWRIPLQHRFGNGHVYSSDFISDDEAQKLLLTNINEDVDDEPRVIKFLTGKRKQAWHKNCVAIGLSAGFLEPLESTGIHLIQSAISRLLTLFPGRDFAVQDINEFNKQTDFELDRIRDFIILHYTATQRDDSEFWRYCRNMQIPDSLSQRIDLFKSHGRIFRDNDELFTDLAWLQVMIGQGIFPNQYHPVADAVEESKVAKFLADLRQIYAREVPHLSLHADFLQKL